MSGEFLKNSYKPNNLEKTKRKNKNELEYSRKKICKPKGYIYNKLESLILAQDKRWRRT